MVHLHLHTDGSQLDGMADIDRVITRVKELGMNSVGISDHGNMIKALEFQEKCIKEGIKPILGCEFYMAEKDTNDNYHILLIAKDNVGLKNLYKLNSFGFTKNFYYKPRITFEQLLIHKEGLIVTTACLGSEFGQDFINKKANSLADLLVKYKMTFGDDFYLEIQPNQIPIQREYNKFIVQTAQDMNIPLIVTCDAHYVTREDYKAHDVMLAMQVQKKVNDPDRFRFTGDDFYIKTEAEICNDLNYIDMHTVHKAMLNTEILASKCNAKIETGLNLLPKIDGIEDENLELAKHCNVGFAKRVLDGMPQIKEYIDRVKYELNIIKQKGYASYFLIVEDYLNFARSKDIMVGAGRGSAAGSLVAYIIGITNIDPIKYELLFERMLNPERIAEPDIDSDFDYERREEVIEYVKNKYGVEHVAHVIAEGTLACNAVVRKVMSAYDYDSAYVNKVCKTVPKDLGITLEKAYNTSEDFKSYMTKHSNEFSIMKRLEGLMSHVSKHAAGIAICSKPIDDYVPCMSDSEDRSMLMTQWDKYKLAKVGLYKFDFLGLKTLTIVRKTLKNIQRNYGITVKLEDIDLEDSSIYECLNSGDLSGVFQFDAPAGKQTIGEVKPTCFKDIIAATSICRPGVKESKLYVHNKANGYERTGNKIVDDILEDTYGAIVFQEQTMLIMNKLTGGRWSLGKADNMRKVKDLEEYREDFIQCCEANGCDSAYADSIFSRFDLGYTFNKSHAVSYSVLSAHCAYLMQNFRKEFMSAVMTMEMTKTDSELAKQIKECIKHNINILPPDINESGLDFNPLEEGIRFPLTAIHGVGDKAVEEIINKRTTPYTSLIQFKDRVTKAKVNKKSISSLIKVGAFDKIESVFLGNRNAILSMYYNLIGDKKELMTWCKEIHQQYEKELLGICLTSNPMSEYACIPLNKYTDGINITVPGMVTEIKVIQDRNSNSMAFVTCENIADTFEIIFFARTYAQYQQLLVDNIKLSITGKKEGNKILVEKVRLL